MLPAKVTMTVRNITEFTSVIDIDGEINAAAENALMDAYTQATTAGASTIILNFEQMDYMNSSGIGLLVTLLIRVNRAKQKLLVYGLSDHYRQIFELTRLSEAIEMFPNEAEAMKRVRARA